jgi:hypothetical protein
MDVLISPRPSRVARWYIFKPKIQIWVNFGVFCIERCWCTYFMAIRNIFWQFGIFYVWPFGNLVAIWYTFPRFGIFYQQKSGNPDVFNQILPHPYFRSDMSTEKGPAIIESWFESRQGICKVFRGT